MRLINILPVVAQLAQLAYAHSSSVANSMQGPWNALSVLLAALHTFPHHTGIVVNIIPSGPKVYSTTTSTETLPTTSTPIQHPPTTVTVVVTVAPDHEYTGRKQQIGTPLTSSNTFSNATSGIEATTPTTTAATQPSLAESYELRSFSTDVPAATLTRGGPEPVLDATDSAHNGTLSTATVAPTVWITETVFADETSSVLQAYSTNTLTWNNTFTNATSVPNAIDPATGLTNTGDAVGMTTLTSTASKASATSTITLTDTDLVIPVQANNTQPINVPDSTTQSYKDATATETMTSPMTSLTDEPVVSIQPLGTAPASPSLSGHPPLVTGDQGHRNWNMSTSCTKSRTQKVPALSVYSNDTGASTSTSRTSRVFIGYPPALSGYSNSNSADRSTGFHESSTPIELATAPTATHIEIPPPPTVPLNSCSPGIWGRPGCLSTPTSFSDAASTAADHRDHQPPVSAATLAEIPPPPTVPLDSCTTGIWGRPGCLSTPASFFESSTQAQLSTASAAIHVEIPPPPTIPLDSCSPGIWGRPGCLSTPTNFLNAASTPSTPQAQNSTASPVTTIVPANTQTQALPTSNNSTAQPGRAQCTTSFYSLPTCACTLTVYASKKTVTINCLGCVGHHALPSIVSNGGSVSHRPFTTQT
ncbi:hypothetical protein Q7P35_011311 [Cladosporium inversicolor]